MKFTLSFVAASALLFASSLALPVDSDAGTQADQPAENKDPQGFKPNAMGTPTCKSKYFVDLCITAKDSGAYCDGNLSFHCNKHGTCGGNCWCE